MAAPARHPTEVATPAPGTSTFGGTGVVGTVGLTRGAVVESAATKAAALMLLGGMTLGGGGTATTANPPPGPLFRQPGSWTSTVGAGTVRVVTGARQTRERDSGVMQVVGPSQAAGGPSGSESDTAATQADMVRMVRATSGLTWEQLGRVFGVSRRAVHLWANGGRMNASNAELLGQLVALVRRTPADSPDARRAALLAPGADQTSPIDALRARHRSAGADITGTPFGPDELLGALHDTADGDTAHT